MNLFYDFKVDKAAKTVVITREFAADPDLVWDAFTKAEILDLWYAPKPYKAVTKEMDFREGGHWLYAMVSPEDVKRWSRVEFVEIKPKTTFYTRITFCDENGKAINDAFSMTRNSFNAGTNTTTVIVEKKFNDLATLEMLVSMGFKEGMAAAMANLDEYFLSAVQN